MMRLFLISIFVWSAVGSATAQEAPIRDFVWGLPKEIIKENEKGTFVGEETTEEGDVLFFLDKIRGIRSTIGYEFVDNKLWRARIFIEKKYHNPPERLDDLLTIQTDVTTRFGNPIAEDMRWLDKREMNHPPAWGWAVFRGELIMTTIWRDKETEVTTYLGAPKKYNPVLSVTYEHLATKMQLQQLEREKMLKAP